MESSVRHKIDEEGEENPRPVDAAGAEVAESDNSAAVAVGRTGNTMLQPPIDPSLSPICSTPSEDSSDEPSANDIDSPPQVQTAGQKNQADLVTGGDGSVTDDNSGSEDSDLDKDICSEDSDLDRDMFANDYVKVTPEEWAKISAEELKEITNKFICGSPKFDDFQLLLANKRGSGYFVEYFFTFRAKCSLDNELCFYEAKCNRAYVYDAKLIWTDAIEFVRPKDDHYQVTAPMST